MKKKFIIIGLIATIIIFIIGNIGVYFYINHQKENEITQQLLNFKESFVVPDSTNYNEEEKYQQEELLKQIDNYIDSRNVEKLSQTEQKIKKLHANHIKRLIEKEELQKQKNIEYEQQKQREENEQKARRAYWHEWCQNTPDSNPDKINHCM